jgi:hypothetical protein
MPCWTVRETTVALEAADIGLLQKAFANAGWQAEMVGQRLRLRTPAGVEATWKDGRVSMYGTVPDLNPVRREYSRATIVQTAQQKGWQLRFRGDVIEATRRRFA